MSGSRVAVVGIPGKWSTEVLADALESRTGFRLVVDMADVWADLAAGTLRAGSTDLCELDGIVVKKISAEYSPASLDRIELLRIAQSRGVRVFSPPETIVRMIDRLACTVTLGNGAIPMPETVVTEDPAIARDAVHRFGAAVLKPLYSTKARGMVVLEAAAGDAEVDAGIERFRAANPVMYVQRKIDLAGRDYGMIFLGGEYLGTYARVAGGESWDTTIHGGGRYRPHSPPGSTVELASRAERLFGMDFTTVDVADTPQGPVVFEVSAFGGFAGARDGAGVDAAALYADYALREVRR